ncbi:unnamed protein product [Anisakis simplex]|uniref:HAP1 N-terminal domain-containing protein n=2 Tax=Anisakis simplex TaxID=6269 RepID=A0A0M3IYZ4_ANISI|nr:unnamed protein product [Anisakis simplex]
MSRTGTISEKDAQLMDLNNQLYVMEVNLMKLETELKNANDHLDVERESNKTLQNALDELEEMLGQKNAELIESNENAIKANSNAQLHKETVFDLETKLTLQGRELKDTRSKLLSLKSKIKRLEKESSELLPGSKFSSPQSTPTTTNLTSPDSIPKTSSV